MTYDQIAEMMEEMGLPFAYHHFAEGDSPQCGEMSRSDRGDGTVRVSGYSAESLRAWQRTAGSAADSSGTAGLCLCDQGGERIDILKERTATLRAESHHPPCVLENHPADSRLQISENGKVQTLTSRCGTGGGNVPLLMDTPKTLKIRCGIPILFSATSRQRLLL